MPDASPSGANLRKTFFAQMRQQRTVDQELRRGNVRDRLFAFVTSHQAAAFLAEAPLARELIHIKSSITDHLERIMLSQFGDVMCWRERCMIERVARIAAFTASRTRRPFGWLGAGPMTQ